MFSLEKTQLLKVLFDLFGVLLLHEGFFINFEVKAGKDRAQGKQISFFPQKNPSTEMLPCTTI